MSSRSRADGPGAPRRRGWRVLLALIIGTALLTPVFAANVLGTAQAPFFADWDHFSEALVLAKVETTTPEATARGVDTAGLLVAQPSPVAPYETFNGLRHGERTTSTSYDGYPVQLGLQGYLFTGVYHAGCASVRCLETVNAAMSAAAIVGFALMLALVTSRGFAVVFLVSSAGSPWIVGAARNLYWVPWSWFLPAVAAGCFALAPSRLRRFVAGVAVFLLFALRFGMGFEFLTCFSLLAGSMPLLAWAFRRGPRRTFRAAASDAVVVVAISVVAFAAVAVSTGFAGGRGDLAAGLNTIYQYALVRTYGGHASDPVSALSLTVSPIVVVLIYLFRWTTDVEQIGWSTFADVSLGPGALPVLIVLSAVVVVLRRIAKDDRWRRDLVVLVTGMIAPLSWIVLAKSHAFVHTPIAFLVWYLLGVTSLIWIIADRLREAVVQAAPMISARLQRAEARGRSIGPEAQTLTSDAPR